MRRKTRSPTTRSGSASNTATGRPISTPAAIATIWIAEDAGNEIRYGCGVDCDGGGIGVAVSKDDKSAIIRLERIRIWQNSKPDDEGSELVAGTDDKIFRLDRVERENARSLVTDRKELAALRRK